MQNKPFYKSTGFLVSLGLFFVVLFLFRTDCIPAIVGWWNLLLILIHQKNPPMDSALLPSMIKMVVILMIYFGIFFTSVFVTAQFVLPVHSMQDRFRAFLRLVPYALSLQGPAVFVRDGKMISRVGEEDNIRGKRLIGLLCK